VTSLSPATGYSDAAGPVNTAADLAARALLGALLCDPTRLRDIRWLDSTDFEHWAHQALYQTLTGLAADGKAIDLIALPQLLAEGRYHSMYVDRSGESGPLSATALFDLVRATPPASGPEETADRSHHARYAQLVLEDSIRREVRRTGALIEQYGQQLSGPDAEDAEAAITPVLRYSTAQLARLAERLSSSVSRLSTVHRAASPAPAPDTRAATRQARANQRPPSPEQVARAEPALIGAVLVSRDARALTLNRIDPGDFASPDAAATWIALQSLHRRGEPVDLVLAAAEVERQGTLTRYGRGFGAARLALLADRADVVSGHHAANTVARAALSRIAGEAQRALTQLSEDRSRPATEVLARAQETIDRVAAVASRLAGHPVATPATTGVRPASGQPYRGNAGPPSPRSPRRHQPDARRR
jgi:replicative DNA helicase